MCIIGVNEIFLQGVFIQDRLFRMVYRLIKARKLDALSLPEYPVKDIIHVFCEV
jgi:hypothetical protein